MFERMFEQAISEADVQWVIEKGAILFSGVMTGVLELSHGSE